MIFSLHKINFNESLFYVVELEQLIFNEIIKQNEDSYDCENYNMI